MNDNQLLEALKEKEKKEVEIISAIRLSGLEPFEVHMLLNQIQDSLRIWMKSFPKSGIYEILTEDYRVKKNAFEDAFE